MGGPEVPADAAGNAHRRRTEALRAWLAALAVFALALGARTVFLEQIFRSYLADEHALIADTRFYDLRAREIARGDLLGREPGYLSPVYCVFLGGLYALGADSDAAKGAQAVLGALTCVLVFAVGRRVFGTAAGLIAGCVLALYGYHVFYTGILLPETLVTFLNVAFLALAIPGARAPGLARLLAAGVVLGLAAGARPNALLMLPAASLWALFALRGIALSQRLAAAGALVLGAALAVAPMTARNYLVSGEIVLVSVVGGRNLYKGNGPHANGSHVFLPPGEEGVSLQVILNRDVDPAVAVADDRRMKRRAFNYMRRHPLRTAGLWLKKVYLFLNARELGIRDRPEFAGRDIPVLRWLPFTYGLLAPVGLVGAILALRRPRAGLVHLMLAVQVASFALVFVLGRYRLVAVACLAIFAAGQIVRWAGELRAGDRRSLARSGLLLAALAVPVHWPPAGFPREHGWADQHAALAPHLAAKGDWPGALEAWQGVLEGSWQNDRARRYFHAEIHLEIGRCYLRLGRTAEARQALEQGREVLPEMRGDRSEVEREIEELLREL